MAEGGVEYVSTFMWILPPGAPLRSHNKYQGENPLMILAVGEKRNHFQLYQSTLLFLTRATLRRN